MKQLKTIEEVYDALQNRKQLYQENGEEFTKGVKWPDDIQIGLAKCLLKEGVYVIDDATEGRHGRPN